MASAKRGARYATLPELKAAVRAFAIQKLAAKFGWSPEDVAERFERTEWPGVVIPPDITHPDEREAIEIVDRLWSAIRDATMFAEKHLGEQPASARLRQLGANTNFLRSWAAEFAGLSHMRGLDAHPSPFHERLFDFQTPRVPAEGAKLLNFVRQQDAQRQGLVEPHDDHTLALLALLHGYWPNSGKLVSELTERKVVEVVKKGIRDARLTLASDTSKPGSDE